MKSMSKRASRWLLPTAVVSVTLAIAIFTNTRLASAFGSDGLQHIHERVTCNAHPFMEDSVLDTVVAGNLDEDAAAGLAERYEQYCRFRDNAVYVNMGYRQVVEALREPQAGAVYSIRA